MAASAGVSAVVGAVVSLLAVSQTTVRQRRAERREAARLNLRQTVGALLDELARYQYQAGRPAPKRDDQHAHPEDHAAVVAIRAAAEDLPAWRRALIDRRSRRVFGAYWTDLARDYPSQLDGGSGSFTAQLAAHFHGRGGDPLDSLIHRAYAHPPGHPTQTDLRRELRRLAAAR